MLGPSGDETTNRGGIRRQDTEGPSIQPWLLAALAVSLSAFVWLMVGPLGVLVVIAISAGVEVIAPRVSSVRLPFSAFAGMNAGIVGGWLGGSFLEQNFGPSVGGVSLLPALLGAINGRILLEVLCHRVLSRIHKPEPN